MAHSDALIFLTNITWIFFLFLFTYFFFVLFVLPTFYKKFRTRVLIKNINFLGGILALRNVLVSLVFCVDVFKGLAALVSVSLKTLLFFFKNFVSRTEFSLLPSLETKHVAEHNSIDVLCKYKLNLLFIDLPSTEGSVLFTRYIKL